MAISVATLLQKYSLNWVDGGDVEMWLCLPVAVLLGTNIYQPRNSYLLGLMDTTHTQGKGKDVWAMRHIYSH